MKREAITLDAEKIKLYMARLGLRDKELARRVNVNVKTIQRIKAGRKTSLVTAHLLARKLDCAVDDLINPVNAEDMGYFLPEKWLYDEAPSSGDIRNHLPFGMAIEGRGPGYFVDGPPMYFKNPIEQLLKWHETRGRKIVLRRENQAYIFEIHYFNYSDHEQAVTYFAATACRFFPLARDGDTFRMAPLSDMLDRHVCAELQRTALANAELVSIEGHDYPVHPHAYFPLVRFYQGSILKSIPLGARIFEQLQHDFRLSLWDYLKSLPPERRVIAETTTFGISITVAPTRPAIYKSGWQEEVLKIEVELVWRTPERELALAPWRHAHRKQFMKEIESRDRRDLDSPGMPLGSFAPEGEDDPEIPVFSVDPSLSAHTIAAINGISRPGFEFL